MSTVSSSCSGHEDKLSMISAFAINSNHPLVLLLPNGKMVLSLTAGWSGCRYFLPGVCTLVSVRWAGILKIL